MSEGMHTPGPWTLETVRTICGICHRIGPFPWREGKDLHACVYVDWPGDGAIEAELLANARLIAAAPLLLDALKGLLPILEAVRYTAGLSGTQIKRMEAAKAALAAATQADAGEGR